MRGRSSMVPGLLLAALLAAPAAAEEPVTFEALLHLRGTDTQGTPSTDVLFDRATRTYDVSHYLVPDGGERYASTIAALRASGRHLEDTLRWTLALDTGEVRRRRLDETVPVCRSATSPTGLDVSGQPGCGPLTFQVPGTGRGPTQLSSNGRAFSDEARATWLVREANVSASLGRAGFATVRAGRTRYQVAGGLVYDDYGTGADVRLDLGAIGPPFEVSAAVFQPTRDLPHRASDVSPVALVRADWQVSLFESVGLFAATYRDRADGMAQLFNGAAVEDQVFLLGRLVPGTLAYKTVDRVLTAVLTRQLSSDASLAWLGSSGAIVPWRSHRLTWSAAWLTGRIHHLSAAEGTPLATDVPLSGWAAQARWDWSPSDRFTVSPWVLYLSGDRSPMEKHRLTLPAGYDGFLGIAPYVTATNLFFGGGLSETFAARQASAPGVNGRGVLAPGLTLEGGLTASLEAVARVAWLRAEATGPYGGRTYGTETDLELAWTALPWLTFAAELDLLFPGDFFGGRQTASKVVLGVNAVTP